MRSSPHDDKIHATGVGHEVISSGDNKNKPSTLDTLELQLQRFVKRQSPVPDMEEDGFDADSYSGEYNDEIKAKKPLSKRWTIHDSATMKQCSERSLSTWESTLFGSANGRSERDLDNLIDVEFDIECNSLRREDSTILEDSASRGRADGMMQSMTRRFRPPGSTDEEFSLMSPSQSGSSASGSSEKAVKPITNEDSGLFTAKWVGQMLKDRREAKKTALEEKLMNQMALIISHHKAEMEAMETTLNQKEAAIKTLEKALSLKTESVDELRNNEKILRLELDQRKHQLKKALKADTAMESIDQKVVRRSRKPTRRSGLQRGRSCKSLDDEIHYQIDDEVECEETNEGAAILSISRFAQSLEHSNHDEKKLGKGGFDGSSPLLSLMHGSGEKVKAIADDSVRTLKERSRHMRTRLKKEDDDHCKAVRESSATSTNATINRSSSLVLSHHNMSEDMGDSKRRSSVRGRRRSGAPPVTEPLVPPVRPTSARYPSSSAIQDLPTRRTPPPSLSKSASQRYLMRNPIYIDLDNEV